MGYTDKIKIVSLGDASFVQEIDVRLRTLILCTENTIPGSRAFGLPRDYLDSNLNEAQNLFAIELQDKADRYVPEVSVESVSIDYDLHGLLSGTINVERRVGDD